jgi:threonine aldolase
LRRLSRAASFAVHVDGARVWHAHVATGTPLAALGGDVADTMAVALSKGLGAPMGSLMLGSREHVAQARVWRKRLGGGWRQAGVLAAAGHYALDHHLDRLAEDHAHAVLLADAVSVPSESVDTNIVVIPNSDARAVVRHCADEGVLVSALGPHVVRAVTHLDVSADDARRAADVLARAVAQSSGDGSVPPSGP